jgi:hypothetical protein
MGVAAYAVVGSGGEWRIRHDGKNDNVYQTKESAFEAAVAAASLALRQGHEVQISVPGSETATGAADVGRDRTFLPFLRYRPPNEFAEKLTMNANPRPTPDDFNALKEIVGGSPADAQRLVACHWVEEFDGIALLAASGIEAAKLLSSVS